MNAWPGSMRRVKAQPIDDVILSTFRPGRIYNHNDVRVRLKDIGYRVEMEVIKQSLRRMKLGGRVRIIEESTGGKDKHGAAYALAE